VAGLHSLLSVKRFLELSCSFATKGEKLGRG
jgi:hypothetical protein